MTFFGDYISAFKFLHVLENDQGFLAHTQTALSGEDCWPINRCPNEPINLPRCYRNSDSDCENTCHQGISVGY